MSCHFLCFADYANRVLIDEAKKVLPTIPIQPVGYNDAQILLA
jgi:hypothetical protein